MEATTLVNYETFKETLITKLCSLLPDASVETVNINKNNNVTLEGIRIAIPGTAMAPVFYPHSIFESGYKDPIRAAGYIAEQVERELPYDYRIADEITDYNKMRKKLFIRLVNSKRNENMKNMPHTPILDLTATYAISLDEDCSATISVNDSIFNAWNIDLKTLHTAALRGTARLGCKVTPMNDILSDLIPDSCEDDTPQVPMYVLSNKLNIFGASAILLPEFENLISTKLGSLFYSIPASVHEWILLPMQSVEDPADITSVIHQVNENSVDDTEVLGDHVYLYSHGKLCMV